MRPTWQAALLVASTTIRPPTMSNTPVEQQLLQRVSLADLDTAYAIESASYPADEAATREKLQLRIELAGDYFYGYCMLLPCSLCVASSLAYIARALALLKQNFWFL